MSDSGLSDRIGSLVTALEAQAAALDRHTEAIEQFTAAMNAVADSHAQLIAVLLAPEEDGPNEPQTIDEVAITLAHSGVLSANGEAQ